MKVRYTREYLDAKSLTYRTLYHNEVGPATNGDIMTTWYLGGVTVYVRYKTRLE